MTTSNHTAAPAGAARSTPGSIFPPGTFRPDPRPASRLRMLIAQSRLELTLLLRNGEQLLLTLLIPVTLLIGLALLPLGGGDRTERLTTLVPAIVAIAIMSTAFTGQAIAVGFDRRYGALKRLGATPLPRWGIIAGKSAAVLCVVTLQALVLGGIGAVLGWRPDPAGLALGAVLIALGTVTFSALGLLLGGTLKAEVVLALANVIWFLFAGICGLVYARDAVPAAVHTLIALTPPGALAIGLTEVVGGTLTALPLLVLVVWGAVCGGAAVRYFRFV